MDRFKLLCEDCKRCRRTSSGNLVCTTIGDPALVLRYGNKCRRYQAKRRTFEDATPREYCETCLFFCAGTGDDPDLCMEEPTAEDTTTDSRAVIIRCKLFQPK